MATTSKYFVVNTNGDNTNIIDFDLRYGALTTVGESIHYNGSPKRDAIFVRPGLTYDLSNTAGANDKIYLTGSLSDYALQVDSVNSTLTLTRNSLNESVKVSKGTPTAFDSLIFANGMVNTFALFNAVVSSVTLTPDASVETSLAPLATSGAGTSAVLNATINAYAINQSGGTFASVKPGVNLIVNGSAGIDKVYVADGASVNATNLAGGVDLIYMRGNWADYTKVLNTVNNTITFTRSINLKSESITVATGTSTAFDRVIFADGAVNTYRASLALTSSLTAPIAGITGYNPAITTPLYNDTQVADALAVIRDAAQGNTATSTTPSLLTYVTAGVTGVTAGNLAAINSALNSASVTGTQADTAVNVQAIITAYTAILAEANDTTNTAVDDTADATPLVDPTTAQYAAIGATIGTAATDVENLALLNDIVGAKQFADVDTVSKINALAVIANAIQTVAAGGTPSPALTVADLTNAGLTNVTADNLAAVLAAIAAKANDGRETDSLSEIQALVTVANAALAKIEAYNNGNGTTPAALTLDDYANAGITGVSANNLAAVNAQVLAQNTGGADTAPEVQLLVTAANTALATIEAYNNGNGTTPAALTLADYIAVGVTGVTSDNLAAVNAQVLAQTPGGADNQPAVQILVNAANQALAKIEAYNNGNGSTPAALTVADYIAAGVSGVTSGNLAAVNAQVLAQTTGGADTQPEVQALVTTANSAVAKIEAYNNGDGSTPAALTVADYVAAGITGVSTNNLAATNANILALASGGADTVPEIQAQVTTVADALAKIEAYNNGNGTAPVALTVADYVAAGITGVSTDNLAAVNAQVLAQGTGGADTALEVQALVTTANTAIQKIEAYNNGTGTAPAALTLADYANAGITGVTADNLAAVNSQVLTQAAGGADTAPEVQLLVAAANTALAKIEAYNNGNGTTPAALTVADYVAAGITGVTSDNLAAVNAQVLAQTPGGADTAPEVQALVTTANTAIQKIEAYNNGDGSTPAALSVADYVAAGITGVSANNLAAINVQVLAQTPGGADTAPEVQLLVAAANTALAKIEAYNNGDGTMPAALTLADYVAAGVTGVTSDNLAAVNAQVLAQTPGGADNQPAVQILVAAANTALAKIEAYNNGNGATPAALTVADYIAAGVSGVTSDNLAAVNAQVLAQTTGGADTAPEVQALVTTANTAIAKIEAYNNGDGSTPAALTVADYVAAGITGVSTNNLVATNANILALASGGADTVPEIQAQVTAVADALVKIEAYNNGNGTTPAALTVADYVAAGITGVSTDNLAAVNAQVLAQGTGGADTVLEVQALVTAANTAIAKIEAYNNGNGTAPVALTVTDYEAAGITGVTADNLAAVNAQVLIQATGGADTAPEVQLLVAAANTALAKIEAYNNGNGTTPAALTVADYVAAGVTGVSADNLAAVNAQVLAQGTGGADTQPEVQLLVTAANAAIAKIEAYNNGTGTLPAALTVADYVAAGITGVTADNLAAVNAQVLAQATGGADTSPEVQALVTAANTAIGKIEAYNNGDGSTPAPLTVADYIAAGVSGVTSDNLAAVNAQVLAQTSGGADTAPEVQLLVATANAALAKIEAYNNGDGTTPAPLTVADYIAAGVIGVTSGNLAAVNAQVLAQTPGGADTAPEVQALVTTANTAIQKIEDYNNGDGTAPAALTLADYANAGITGVSANNLAAVNAQVLAQATGGADTAPEVQLLVATANAALAKIEAYNNGDGTTPVALTLADYIAAGVTGVSANNLAAVNAQVLAQTQGGADTSPEVQLLVAAANTALAKIEAYNNGNGATPAALTVADYIAAGVSGVTSSNVAAVNAQVLAQTTGGADTAPEVQALVTTANAAIQKIEDYNNGDGTAPVALTVTDYVAAGITGVSTSNLAAINGNILALSPGGADTVAEIQAQVTAVADALAKIEAYNGGNGTTPAALTVADYVAAGITGVSTDNLAAVNAQVLAQSTGGADTALEVQALVTAANAAIAKIEAYNGGNGTTPVALTVADYEAAGITGVTADNLAAVNAQVLAQTTGGADTAPEVQLLVAAANTALAKIEAYNNGNGTTPAALTVADYVAAGITGVTADNLAAVNAQVLAQATGGADTSPEVQLLVTAANAAIAKIEAYNGGNGTSPAALTLDDYANAGITGVSANNLAAVNAQVLAQGSGGADTSPEVQLLVAAANSALAKIEVYNNGNGITPAALTLADYVAAGVTGVTSDNLAAVNAQVLAQTSGGADTSPEVQLLVAAANTALAKIEAYNGGDGTTPAALTVADYIAAGVSGVTSDNLAAVNAQVLAQTQAGADTAPEVQALVTAANAAIQKIEDYNNGNGTAPAALTVADYVAAGITGVSTNNVVAINANILALAPGGADTVPEIQAQVTAVADALVKIEAYNNGNGTAPVALTVADYVAAGITGVSTDNLAAVNAKVLAQSAGGADTALEVQALVTAANTAIAKIEAYNNGNGTSPVALTVADYEAAGITGVTADNLAAVNSQVLAQATGGADTAPEVQLLVAAANTALAKIEAYNNGNGTTPAALTVADYVAAGITGVTSDNLAAVNAQVLAQTPGGADTAPEVQLLVTAANAAIAKIEAYNNGNGTSPVALTVADYEAAGITGVTADNLAAVNAQVLAQTPGGADTAPEVQLLVTAANAALAKIEAYNAGNGTTPAALTLADYVAAGITGVTADNLAAVNAQVLAQVTGGADTAPEVQALVTGLNTAASTLGVFAQANSTGLAGATGTAPVLADYTAAGVTGVTTGVGGNLSAINDALASLPVTGTQADSPAELQAIVDAYIIILAEANDVNNAAGDDTADATPADPTAAQYALIGATIGTAATVAANLSLLNDIVGAKQFADVDTVGEINELARIANAIQTVAAGGTASPALTATDLANAGLANVTADNLAAVLAAIAAKANDGSETDSLSELQALVTGLNTAASTLGTFAQANTLGVATPTGTVPVLADYTAAGVTGVTDGVGGNLAAINDALASAPVGATQADSPAELQAIVDAYTVILAEANDTTDTAGNSIADANIAINPTAAQYEVIGATIGNAATDAENLSLLNDIVGAKRTVDVDTVGEINALAVIANAIQTVAADGTPSPVLTTADFTKAGLTAVTDSNLSAVITAIAAKTNDGSETDSLGELQTIITDIASHFPVLTTALGGVTNLDVTSNLVLTSTRSLNVGTGFIRFTDLGGSNGGTGFHTDNTTNSFTIDVSTAVTGGLLSFDATRTKIIINPTFDLDLSSNYSISIDAGAFVDQSTGSVSYALAAVNFSTVTPGTHSVGGLLVNEALASQIMDANGALQPSKSWIDLESYNTNNINGITQIGDLSTGAYALVMKNYATAPGGVYPDPNDGGSVGIQLHDVSIGVSNFSANDQLYFDGQANNLAIQKFAPEYLSAILNASGYSGGIAGQNLLNFDYDTVGYTPSGSSNQIALGFQGSTQIFQFIYPYAGYSDMATTLGIPAPVVMG